ncbi:MAG TPA: serine/threonine-protein kinase [Myxococcota bacterium]|nr:serine/threonine-protein kinase [Myxococcota bacterium]
MPKRIKDYKIVETLGRGGMGEVFLATHQQLDRPVAIKRYAPAPGTKDDKKNRERFLREGRALAKLHHQGIVGIYDYFEQRGQLYMVLEYVEGFQVGKLIEGGPLSLDVACIIGFKLADALEHAHFHRIIHRDIKTSNVMVSRDGQVKLMDFGIARGEVLERITQTGLLVGTPAYFPPEVIAGHEASELSDIYGMGAVLYHCLSGRKLFFQVDDKSLYKAILAGKFVRLQKVVRGIPRGLRNIVHKCLAKKPEERYQSAADLRQTLDLFMAGQCMWTNHAERLAGFLQAAEHLQEPPLTSIDISVSDLLVKSTPVRRPGTGRGIKWIVFGTLAIALAGLIWFAWENGWIERVLQTMGPGGG